MKLSQPEELATGCGNRFGVIYLGKKGQPLRAKLFEGVGQFVDELLEEEADIINTVVADQGLAVVNEHLDDVRKADLLLPVFFELAFFELEVLVYAARWSLDLHFFFDFFRFFKS